MLEAWLFRAIPFTLFMSIVYWVIVVKSVVLSMYVCVRVRACVRGCACVWCKGPETVPSEDCSMITDGCSVVTDGCSMVTGASSIGPPAPPCGSPVTVAAMDEEGSVEEGTWQ